MDYSKYVNVFQGCSTVELPEPKGIAASWHFIKAITGNTTPAATLPFGRYSCCMYTTAYPTGYGDHYPNSSPNNLRCLEQGARFYGLSHFHQSGTGALEYYYNYAVITPFFGDSSKLRSYDIESEEACPGYYQVKSEGGILSETTVSDNSTYHRFTFPDVSGHIAVDFTNDGLFKIHNQYRRPEFGRIILTGDTEACAEVSIDGLIQYFVFRAQGAKCVSLLKNNEPVDGNEISFSCTEDTYGILLDADDVCVNTRLSVSMTSMKRALECIEAYDGGFDEVKAAAYEKWNECLSKIEIECDDKKELEIFYSNLYHSLVKPSDKSDDCPIWKDSELVIDISTAWDVYKTEYPLLYTLYPEISEKLVKSIFNFGKTLGEFPHTALMKKGFLEKTNQACLLAEYTVCDAFYRGISADYKDNFSVILTDITREKHAKMLSGKVPARITHLLDLCDACNSVAAVAENLGLIDYAERLKKIGSRWIECYDSSTGLLCAEHDYYEGTLWNYSFRLQHYMQQRIELAGGKQKFIELLDRFFGYTNLESVSTRFEGYNNEPDMETPYAYNYVNRHDRVCEIVDLGVRYMFADGRGGIPGNNDSGGLSSCYIWNTIGIFPVTGQNLMIIGTPHFNRVVLHLGNGKTFTVIREGEGIYVETASLDLRVLNDFTFSVTRMMQGGTLLVKMCEKLNLTE